MACTRIIKLLGRQCHPVMRRAERVRRLTASSREQTGSLCRRVCRYSRRQQEARIPQSGIEARSVREKESRQTYRSRDADRKALAVWQRTTENWRDAIAIVGGSMPIKALDEAQKSRSSDIAKTTGMARPETDYSWKLITSPFGD